MSGRFAMGVKVGGASVRPQREAGSQPVRTDGREGTRDENTAAAMASLGPLFGRAIDEWGKRDAYAERVGIARSVLSEMVAGQRLIGPRDWLPLHENPEAWRAWLDGLAELGPEVVRIVRVGPVTKAQACVRLVMLVVKLRRDLGMERDELRAVLQDALDDDGAAA